jgi:hypothetical protein
MIANTKLVKILTKLGDEARLGLAGWAFTSAINVSIVISGKPVCSEAVWLSVICLLSICIKSMYYSHVTSIIQ